MQILIFLKLGFHSMDFAHLFQSNICAAVQHFLIWRCSYLIIQTDGHYASFTNINTIQKEQVVVNFMYILNIKIN